MSKEEKKIIDIRTGEPLRDYPKTRLVPKMTTIEGGLTGVEFVEVPVDGMPVIDAVRPPPKELEVEVRTEPSKHELTNHRLVDAKSWGHFREPVGPRPKVIYGATAPIKNVVPRGAVSQTRSEVETRADREGKANVLLRALLGREKDKK